MKALYLLLGVIVIGGAGWWLLNRPTVPAATTDLYSSSSISSSFSTPMSSFPSSITPVHERVQVTMMTSKGVIQLELDGTAAPYTVGNFVGLAQKGTYNGTLFH